MTDTSTRARIPVFELPDRLRKSLEHADIEADDMAQWLEVHVNTVRNWIAGRTRPRASDLKQWSLRVDIPHEWLAHGITPDEVPEPRSEHQRSHYEPERDPVDPFDPATGQTRAVAALQKRLRQRVPVDAAMQGR